MDKQGALINSINNVRQLINNAILMLRDLDTVLSKYGFEPLNGNALGTESSKSIMQTMDQYSTFFPQYIARQYAIKSELDSRSVSKIIFTNIQFFHGDYEELPPTFTNSVMLLPTPLADVKASIGNWWLKYMVYEDLKWEHVKKNGELNKDVDDEGYTTIFWCNNLIDFDSQEKLIKEAEKIVAQFKRLT